MKTKVIISVIALILCIATTVGLRIATDPFESCTLVDRNTIS